MNREELDEKLLIEKNARLIDEIEFNNKKYVKALKINKEDIEYKYYELLENNLKDVEDEITLKYLKELNEANYGDIIY